MRIAFLKKLVAGHEYLLDILIYLLIVAKAIVDNKRPMNQTIVLKAY